MKKETSNMFLTGPKVVKTVTGEDVTQEQLEEPRCTPPSRAWRSSP